MTFAIVELAGQPLFCSGSDFSKTGIRLVL
jgi:uncharacterized protein with PIN domain